ncbi:uncharacterized protein LOC141714395 [Apium graveolens]|uniref:uncharacterized protein LOC141714395 n=1 Tax=Apium graveolens TaxID=4045 RepID=UPI003D79A888
MELSWAGQPTSSSILYEMNTQLRPNIIFISETLVKQNKVEKVSKKLGFANYFAVDVQGHGGGIALFWKNEEGDIYTWEHARGTERWVQERLDRGLATDKWMEMFPGAEVQLHKQVYVQKTSRFKFENMWVKESECRNIIQMCWNDETTTSLMDKMVICCAKLEEWGENLVKDMNTKLRKYRADMKRFRSRRDKAGTQQYGEARWKYMKLLEKKKYFGVKEPNNSGCVMEIKILDFFYKYASSRKEHNKIKKLKDEEGVWRKTDEKIQGLINGYFESIFRTTNRDDKLPDRIQFKHLSVDQMHDLVVPINDEEVKAAVFDMHPDKALGIDGLNPSFFQAYWSIVGKDICMFFQQFFATGELPEKINNTLVCLMS